MNITESLYKEVKDLWKMASEKQFLIEMANGTLDEDKYKRYMLQDYFYLLEYKEILARLLELSDDSEAESFVKIAIDVTVYETESVHLPAMKKLGITEDEIKNTGMNQVIREYINFYHKTIDKYGFLGGFTALLQCCWDYAYLGKVMYENYGEKIEKSPYKFWFDAYTSKEYVETNETWKKIEDRLTAGIDEKKAENLREIFRTCAEFEDKFWDVLFN